MPSAHGHPILRRLLITLVAVVLFFVVLQLVASPLAKWEVRRSLAHMQSFVGRVEDVHASVFPPKVRMEGLRVIQREGGDWKQPLLSSREVRMALDWRKLADFITVLDVKVTEPELRIVQKTRAAGSAQSAKGKARRMPDLAQELQRAAPLDFGAVHIVGGKLVAVDETRTPAPTLTVSDVAASVDNLTTRPGLAAHRPTILRMTGKVQNTGEMKVELTAHPFAKLLDFDGKMEVVHLAAPDLDSLLAGTEKMKATSGSLDIFAEFKAKDGYITGGVKPVAHNLELAAAHDADLFHRFKAWVADTALDLFSEKKPNEKRVATVVPIKGNVMDPDAQLWPTVAGVLRNALVQGVGAGFQGVPPPTARHKQSVPKQLIHALSGKKPKAQPQGGGH